MNTAPQMIQARGLQRGDTIRLPEVTADQLVMDAYQLDATTVVADLYSRPTSGLEGPHTFRPDELVQVTNRVAR